MNKKIMIILLVVILVGLVSWVVWYYGGSETMIVRSPNIQSNELDSVFEGLNEVYSEIIENKLELSPNFVLSSVSINNNVGSLNKSIIPRANAKRWYNLNLGTTYCDEDPGCSFGTYHCGPGQTPYDCYRCFGTWGPYNYTLYFNDCGPGGGAQ